MARPLEGKDLQMTEYTATFYEKQSDGSARSAARIVPVVLDLLPGLQSVVDVGCGVGTFLEKFRNNGVPWVQGIDGDYVERDLLRIDQNRFEARDLSTPMSFERRFDLAVSLEVAEHLLPSRAHSFVEDLTELSDLVLFSAAIPGQGGTHHVNERWQDYWAGEFKEFGYYALDAIRHQIWDFDDVESWYRQNTILYANLNALGRYPGLLSFRTASLPSLRVVHPATWAAQPGPKELLRTVGEAIPIYLRKAGERLRGKQ